MDTADGLDAEILVHVTAPSRTADDAAYRQLAQAYLSFQPDSRTRISALRRCSVEHIAEDEREEGEEGETYDPLSLPEQQMPSSSGEQFVTGATDMHAFDLDSADLSFQSALDNRSSPRLRTSHFNTTPSKMAFPGSSQASSWCAPPSQIADSYPMPDAQLLRASPTRVLQQYLRGFSTLNDAQASPPSPCPAPGGRSEPSVRDQKVCIPSSISIPSTAEESSQPQDRVDASNVIPVTPVVPVAVRHQQRKHPVQDDDETRIEETRILSSSLESQTSTGSQVRAGSEPLVSKRPKLIDNEAIGLNLIRSSSDTGPMTAIFAGSDMPSSIANARLVEAALEIRPPSPPVGLSDIQPTSLVSDKLAKLARDLSSRYRPQIKRDPEPFERGYWLLNCAEWSSETRREAWMFLASYLRSGLAGWGVWCRRDSSHSWIRLYCWGHVAKHTYLLLYLASGRKMKVTGAEWFGADGEIALEVLPNERQAPPL